MLALGFHSKREITRTKIRVRTAMATQTREQGRYLDGRPPYGYQLADACPHPNRVHAACAPAGAGSGHRAGGGVDIRRAAGRAQRRPDRPGAERRRYPVSVRRRPQAEPAPRGNSVDIEYGSSDPRQPAVHGAAGLESSAHRLRPG